MSYSHYNDQELILLLNQEDKQAYLEIYDRFHSLLFLHAVKKMRDEDDAKDAVQEIFTNLWTRREDLKLQTSLASYLFTCVRNKFVNMLQHREVRARYVDSFQGFIDQSPVLSDHLIRENQLAELIEKEINALPAKMRQVFLMSRKEHKSYKEIAGELDISEETVKKQVKNALKILRVRLGLISFLIFLIYH